MHILNFTRSSETNLSSHGFTLRWGPLKPSTEKVSHTGAQAIQLGMTHQTQAWGAPPQPSRLPSASQAVHPATAAPPPRSPMPGQSSHPWCRAPPRIAASSHCGDLC